MDHELLIKAFENESNTCIIETSHSEIKKKKNDILQKLQIKGIELKKMHATLVGYKYIDDIRDLCIGRYVRWISLKRSDNKISLTNGAHICNINIDYIPVSDDDDDDDDNYHDNYITAYEKDEPLECKSCVRCKVVRCGKVLFFNLNFEENLFFQKITEQEWVILDALEYLK